MRKKGVAYGHYSLYQLVRFRRPDPGYIPFVTALGAQEAWHHAQIALLGEATYLMKDYIAEQIHGVDRGALKDLLARAIT